MLNEFLWAMPFVCFGAGFFCGLTAAYRIWSLEFDNVYKIAFAHGVRSMRDRCNDEAELLLVMNAQIGADD